MVAAEAPTGHRWWKGGSVITVLDHDPARAERIEALRREYDADEHGRGKNAMVQRILADGRMRDDARASIDGNDVPSQVDVPPLATVRDRSERSGQPLLTGRRPQSNHF